MKNTHAVTILALAIASLISTAVLAQNIIRTTAPVVQNKVLHNWKPASAHYTEWFNNGSAENCTNWSPLPGAVGLGVNFTQTATDCDQNQSRVVQERQVSQATGEFRNFGTAVEEIRIIGASITRQAIGTLAQWMAAQPTYTDWVDQGAIYGCSVWAPDPLTIRIGDTFVQSSDDCKQNQSRMRQNREQEGNTQVYRDSGEPIAELQVLEGKSSTRNAIGTLEAWVAAEPSYTPWTDTNSAYNCVGWTPSPSTQTSSATFLQSSSGCQTDQSRNRQAREQETTTLAYRDVGTPVPEDRTLPNQSASRNYTVSLGNWINAGSAYDCMVWSPAVTTVVVGQSFIQTANDCKVDQTRVRSESYVDHKTAVAIAVGVAGEQRTVGAQTNTRTATGSKETWVAALASYTAWTNTNAQYDCNVWSPSGASKMASEVFTQTAGDCKTDQTRNSQAREQETTTLAYRNMGAPVVQSQTISNQPASRTYTVSLGGWSNTSSIYGCSNWSPSVAASQKAISFTQTATDCKINQSRTRYESYVDHKTGSTVGAAKPNDTRVATTSQSQTAVGTKVVTMCDYYFTAGVNQNIWKFFADGNAVWTGTLIPGSQSMWFSTETLQIPFSNPAAYYPGLTRLSSTEFRYVSGGFNWRIFRGSYVGQTDGFIMYRLCVE